jgi:hypothetical protein
MSRCDEFAMVAQALFLSLHDLSSLVAGLLS